jgi:hypothetical protein
MVVYFLVFVATIICHSSAVNELCTRRKDGFENIVQFSWTDQAVVPALHVLQPAAR